MKASPSTRVLLKQRKFNIFPVLPLVIVTSPKSFLKLLTLVNPYDNSPVVLSLTLCESFLKVFIYKVSALRPTAFSSVGSSPDLTIPPLNAVFDHI